MPPLGLQLLVFKEKFDFEKTPEPVLDAAKAAGFNAVEAQLKDPHRLRNLLDARGLVHAGVHLSPAQLRDPQPWIDYLKATGARDVCNSGMLQWGNHTHADFMATIGILNAAGRALRAEGIHLHYHNHEFEMRERPDGKTRGIDLLAAELDPDACDLCVDVAWVARGGDDPVAFLREHAARVGYLHLKDTDGRNWCELGRGNLDWRAILDCAATLPRVRWWIWEQDSTAIDPAESAAISRRFLREKFGY